MTKGLVVGSLAGLLVYRCRHCNKVIEIPVQNVHQALFELADSGMYAEDDVVFRSFRLHPCSGDAGGVICTLGIADVVCGHWTNTLDKPSEV